MLELAREADWEAVKSLSVQIHDLHSRWRPDIYYSTDEPLPKAVYMEKIRDRMLYVAKMDGIVVGYVLLQILKKDGPGTVEKRQMRLESICVDQGLRGHGIGKQMVADVRALAKVFGCKELILGVHAENDHAVGFYQKCGFRIRTINMDMKI